MQSRSSEGSARAGLCPSINSTEQGILTETSPAERQFNQNQNQASKQTNDTKQQQQGKVSRSLEKKLCGAQWNAKPSLALLWIVHESCGLTKQQLKEMPSQPIFCIVNRNNFPKSETDRPEIKFSRKPYSQTQSDNFQKATTVTEIVSGRMSVQMEVVSWDATRNECSDYATNDNQVQPSTIRNCWEQIINATAQSCTSSCESSFKFGSISFKNLHWLEYLFPWDRIDIAQRSRNFQVTEVRESQETKRNSQNQHLKA